MSRTLTTKGPKLKIDSIKEEGELEEFIQESEKTAAIEPVPKEEKKNLVDGKYFGGRYTPVIEKYLEGTEIALTDEEKVVITVGVKKKCTGLLAAVPLKCIGDRCPFKDACPFHKIGKAPVGYSCPVESMVMDLYTKRYLDEFGVVADSFSETTTMTMLAATHIMEMRAWKVLGEEENSTGVISNVVGFNEAEEPIIQQQEHPAFNILERAWRWRDRLLTSLVGTRREQYKRESALKEKTADNSLAMSAANLKAKIDQLAAAQT